MQNSNICGSCEAYKYLGGYACMTCHRPEAHGVAYSILHRLRSDPSYGFTELSPSEQEEVEFEILSKMTAMIKQIPGGIAVSEKLRKLLGFLADPVINMNRGTDDYAGILFHPKQDEAYFASPEVMGRVARISGKGENALEDVPQDRPFYNYYTQSFQVNPLPMDADQMARMIDNSPQGYNLLLPKNDFMRYLEDRFPPDIYGDIQAQINRLRSVQTIIDVGCARAKGKHLVVPEFKVDEEGRAYFSPAHPETGELILGKHCYIHPKLSKYTGVDKHQAYLAEFIPQEETADAMFLNVIRRFERKVNLGMFRPGDPGAPADKFDIDSFRHIDVFRYDIPVHPDEFINFTPTAVSSAILYSALSVFRGFSQVNLQTGGQTDPIYIEGERDHQDQPHVEVLILPIVEGIKEER